MEEKTKLEQLEALNSLQRDHAEQLNIAQKEAAKAKSIEADYNLAALKYKKVHNMPLSAPFDVEALITREKGLLQEEAAKKQEAELMKKIEKAK